MSDPAFSPAAYDVVCAHGDIVRKYDRVTVVQPVGYVKPGRKGRVLSAAGGYVKASFSRDRPPVEAPAECFALLRPASELGQVRFELEQTARRLEPLGAPGRVHALLLRQLVAGPDSPLPGTAQYASFIYRTAIGEPE